jgi:hypothetical protein
MVKLNCNRVETDLPKNRKQQQEASNKKPINYTLDSQKITFDLRHIFGVLLIS